MTRSRTIPPRRTSQQSSSTKNADWMDSGSVGREKSRREVARAAALKAERMNRPYIPQRFWLGKGESAQIIILDYKQEDMRLFYEHAFFANGGMLNDPELCAGDFGECPACTGELSPVEEHRKRYYALFLSILDLRPYTRKAQNGRPAEVVPYTRKLMVIKSGQHETFMELFRVAQELQGGTLHGTTLKLTRGNDSNSTAIGEPVIIHKGRQFAKYSKDAMIKKFGHEELKNKEGKVYLQKNGALEPFNYGEIFLRPDANSMRVRWGLEAQDGSSNSANEVYGGTEVDDFDDFDDEVDSGTNTTSSEDSDFDEPDNMKTTEKNVAKDQNFDDFDDFDEGDESVETDEDIPFED